MKRNRVQRDGTVVVATAVCLTVIMAFTALSVDGGLLMDSRRQVQSATDAAALAAADDLYLNWWSNKGLDPSGTARAAALATAGQAGFVNGVNGCVVTVNIPPTSGKFVGKAGHTEVLISVYQTRFFSKIWGSDQLPIGGRAVARGRSTEIRRQSSALPRPVRDP